MPEGIQEAYLSIGRDVTARLRVEPEVGLLQAEAERRQKKFGRNEIPRRDPWRLLRLATDRFRDVLVLILIGAGVISLLLGQHEDALIIAIAVAIDATLSFIQIWRTERTLANLRRQVPDTVTVIRGGENRVIPASDLVVGDIFQFRRGERIPADGRLLRTQGLHLQESLLTGEAADVVKTTERLETRTPVSDRVNMIFAGTTVVAGAGVAVITAIGTATQFGRIALMLKKQASPISPLRKKLQQQGLRIGWLIIAVVILLGVLGLLRGEPLPETARMSITLIVSAIPEDLTMILTIALTVGVVRILRNRGAVRELSAGETLGAATVICTDKTGTLTRGEMTATDFHFLQGETIRERMASELPDWQRLALTGMALTASAQRTGNGDQVQYFGSATERCALAFVEARGLTQTDLKQQWRRRDAIAFSTAWKYAAGLFDHPQQEAHYMFVIGAPEILLDRSGEALSPDSGTVDMTSERRVELTGAINQLASLGNRLLGVAVRRHFPGTSLTHADIKGLTFLGVLTIQDPVRGEIAAAIRETQQAGVKVKLVTGDIAGTARAVARAVGLTASEDQVATGEELAEWDDAALGKIIDDTVVFSRVEPLDKQRIIRALKARGHVVAMTGDGVNDAVALKSADIGVAMGSGSDIAKDSADLILLNDSFATIVAAIREGRVIRDNVRKVMAFLLSTNAAEVAIFFVSLALGLPLPLLPAQVLWINLVTDGTSDIALSLEPAERNVMQRPPENPNMSLLDKLLYQQIVWSGIILTAATMGLYWYVLRRLTLPLPYARTMAFTFLSTASLLSVWSFRSLKETILKRGIWQNPWVLGSTVISLGLQLSAIYYKPLQNFFETTALAGRDWLVIITLALVTTCLIDLRKVLLKKNMQSARSGLSA